MIIYTMESVNQIDSLVILHKFYVVVLEELLLYIYQLLITQK